MSKSIEFVAPLSQDEVASLSSDSITKKNYDAILAKIDDRFSYVFEKAMSLMDRSIHWYDFDNVGEDEESRGFFDPESYKEEIRITGNFKTPRDALYEDYIPTKWLWEDFEESLVSEIQAHKATVNAAKASKKKADEAAKKEKAEVIEAIRKKLTKKELSYIVFK